MLLSIDLLYKSSWENGTIIILIPKRKLQMNAKLLFHFLEIKRCIKKLRGIYLFTIIIFNKLR